MEIKKEALEAFIYEINNTEIKIQYEGEPNYLCEPIVLPNNEIFLMPYTSYDDIDPETYSSAKVPPYKQISNIGDIDSSQFADIEDFMRVIVAERRFYQPFTLTFNKKFANRVETPIMINENYLVHITTLRFNTIKEINENINLRIGLWDILDYFNYAQSLIHDSKETYVKTDFNIPWCPSEILVRDLKPMNEMEEFSLMNSFNLKRALSKYWEIQFAAIEEIEKYIDIRLPIIKSAPDYVKSNPDNNISSNNITWSKSDTDLLELVVALHETGAIQNPSKDLSQKEAIAFFSEIFNKEIKDPHKKLNSARLRYKDNFIEKLSDVLEEYYKKQNEKMR